MSPPGDTGHAGQLASLPSETNNPAHHRRGTKRGRSRGCLSGPPPALRGTRSPPRANAQAGGIKDTANAAPRPDAGEQPSGAAPISPAHPGRPSHLERATVPAIAACPYRCWHTGRGDDGKAERGALSKELTLLELRKLPRFRRFTDAGGRRGPLDQRDEVEAVRVGPNHQRHYVVHNAATRERGVRVQAGRQEAAPSTDRATSTAARRVYGTTRRGRPGDATRVAGAASTPARGRRAPSPM
jgi:hypothetical protein